MRPPRPAPAPAAAGVKARRQDRRNEKAVWAAAADGGAGDGVGGGRTERWFALRNAACPDGCDTLCRGVPHLRENSAEVATPLPMGVDRRVRRISYPDDIQRFPKDFSLRGNKDLQPIFSREKTHLAIESVREPPGGTICN